MIQGRTLRVLLGAAAAVVVIGGVKAAAGIVAPTMVALAVTIVFHPIRVRLERRVPRFVATTAVLASAYLLIALFTLGLAISLGQLASLVPTYAPQINDYLDSVSSWLEALGVGHGQSEAMVSSFDAQKLVGLMTSLLSSIAGVLANVFFILALLLFMAADSAYVGRLAGITRAHRPPLVDALSSFAAGTRSYLGVSAIFGL